MSNSAIVIGAGIGGLSAAIRLSAAGWRVRVYERNHFVGGKMGQWVESGFRWDTGPSVITMRPVLEDLFACGGRKLEDFLELIPIEPLTQYFFPDGTKINLSGNLSKTLEQISKIEKRDVEGYLSFLAYAARLHRLTSPVFTFGPPPSLRSARNISMREIPWIGKQGLTSMQAAISKHVTSVHLRQLFGRFATYVGSSPYECSAILSVIAHVEISEGIWYARGGVYSIALALEKLAREMGVEFHMNSEVKVIAHSHKQGQRKTTGVLLEGGEIKNANIVVADIDTASVFGQLLQPSKQFRSPLKRLGGLQKSSSGFILLLGVGKVYPELQHHNIFFSNDYRKEFWQIFHERKPPDDPTIYVAITSKSDRHHAPDGSENWFVLINVPPNDGGYDWVANQKAYADHILEHLAKRGFEVRNNLRIIRTITPGDLEVMSGAAQGSLYGVSFNEKMAPFQRPGNRCRQIRGLYFVGGTTHPGGGVPMVMLSAKVATDMICEDW